MKLTLFLVTMRSGGTNLAVGVKNHLNLLVGSLLDHSLNNCILWGFSRIYMRSLKDHIRIIMGSKWNHISILKESYQDLDRIKMGRNLTYSRQGCSKKFYPPGNQKLQGSSWLKKLPSPKPARVWAHAPLENFKNQRSHIG